MLYNYLFLMRITVKIQTNFHRLLAQEDTDGDRQITIRDSGPKRFLLESISGEKFEVAGTYRLSNLLQELALGRDSAEETVILDMKRIFENPVQRFSRMIRDYFWDGLTRTIDEDGLAKIVSDKKAAPSGNPRIYVPFSDPQAFDYFQQAAKRRTVPGLEVIRLPQNISPEYVRQINNQPGLLSLALREENGNLYGLPFVVPGGRFNEFYGWDSYFEALGLLADKRVDLAKSMVDNFIYEIRHYGKILNANRSYYLTRSQPPFLTSMALTVFEHLPRNAENHQWLAEAFQTAIFEYRTVWMNPDRLTGTGLSRYKGSGSGIPPETEAGHFDAILKPHADRAGLDLQTFTEYYKQGKIKESELNEYFVHDRAVRESGHDTSYRLDNCAANLNTVDLNALLYKYEIDIADTIKGEFKDALFMPGGKTEKSADWYARAEKRKNVMNQLLWNSSRGMFFDYNFVTNKQTGYENATTFYPLWAGLVTPQQAELLLKKALPLFEAPGGIVSGSEASRGVISPQRPQRQWDYPNGWAPHQMLLWQGLINYGYREEARRLAYRWLHMITRNAADYNGTIPEKYDVVNRTHHVFAEYGNVGTEFDYITREGFGWMNASYQVGNLILTQELRNSLEQLIPAEWLFGAAPVR
jgi:alpha,alpha-trehalase